MRDEVHIPTVPAAIMLDATTGYIKLQDFGENTDQELGRALRELTQKGMKRLVFDLRGNPGGALDQAIRVSNRFLPKGNLIVYTRGRVANSDQDYRATESSDYLTLPMVTLVSRTSASASEIVSGALRITIARSSSARRRSARRSCSPSTSVAGRGRGDHDGALLHAERAHDSAAVGRHVRRVPPTFTASRTPTRRTRSPTSNSRTRAGRCTAVVASSPISIVTRALLGFCVTLC